MPVGTFHKITGPITFDHTQRVAAASAHAALNAHKWISISVACQLALEVRDGKMAEPAMQPTPEEIKAAIPEHGIRIDALVALFIARLPNVESFDAFNADFQFVAALDPLEKLIFRTQQGPTTYTSRLAPGASALEKANGASLVSLDDIVVSGESSVMIIAYTVEAYKARCKAHALE
ncbi:hypothetical protein MBLNU13_g04907t1 [Cladosporium sp. NU13]